MNLGNIRAGQTGERVATVTKEMSINRMGREGTDVLSTPGLLELMEWACIETTDDKLPEGHTTVGYAVDGFRHLAPTLVGGVVTVKVDLTEVDRNRLTYSIQAFEGDKSIGVATHKRAVVSTAE